VSIIAEIRTIDNSLKALRKFGLTISSVILLLIAYLFFSYKFNFNDTLIIVLGSVSAILLILSFIFPSALKIPNIIWMTLALIMGFIMSRVILFILFYIGVTPIALIGKIFNQQFLTLNKDETTKSYWNKRKELNYIKTESERQF